MKNKIIILTAIVFVFLGKAKAQYCTSDSRFTEVSFFDSAQISMAANVQYGTALDYQGNSYALKMDLYYPNLTIDKSPKRPFILLAHGGGFSSGDKQSGDIKDLCIHLAMRGFVCATMNYRIGHDFSEYGTYKARYRAIQDGHAAMRHIVNNANAVRVDTSWLFVGGQSAGSLLALGMVYADQSELDSISLLYNITSASAELGNLLTSGNNLTNKYSIKGIFNNWGGVAENEVDKEEMIPTIAFHGEKDTIVPIDSDASFAHYTLLGSRALHDDMVTNKICTELTVDTMGEHGIFRNASSKFRAQRASCFFKSVFCNKCASLYTTDSIPSNCSSTAGLGKYNMESNIQVYPNPFDTEFRIGGIEGNSELKIFNSFGQLIFQKETSNGMAQVDLKPGIYILHINHIKTNRLFTTKIIKN